MHPPVSFAPLNARVDKGVAMTVSSDVSQLLGFLGKFLNELPLGNRSGASASTRDSSFADHLRQLATGSAHMADTPVSQRTPPLQAPMKAQATSVAAAPVKAQAAVAAAPVQAQATAVAAARVITRSGEHKSQLQSLR